MKLIQIYVKFLNKWKINLLYSSFDKNIKKFDLINQKICDVYKAKNSNNVNFIINFLMFENMTKNSEINDFHKNDKQTIEKNKYKYQFLIKLKNLWKIKTNSCNQ